MKSFNKIALFLVMVSFGLQAQNNKVPEISQQDREIVDIILSMEEAINLHQNAQQQIDAANGIFGYNKKPLSSDVMGRLVLQMNQYKASFTKLLDTYLVRFGQVDEKKAGLFGFYKTSYYISSKENQTLSITPNEYTLLMKTLENATKQPDWAKTVFVELSLKDENGSAIAKALTLNEIIAAIKQVPLPAQYSTAAIVAGVAAAGVLAVAAYYGYQELYKDSPVASIADTAVISTPIDTPVQFNEQSETAVKEPAGTSAEGLGYFNPTEKKTAPFDPSSLNSLPAYKHDSGMGDADFSFSDEPGELSDTPEQIAEQAAQKEQALKLLPASNLNDYLTGSVVRNDIEQNNILKIVADLAQLYPSAKVDYQDGRQELTVSDSGIDTIINTVTGQIKYNDSSFGEGFKN